MGCDIHQWIEGKSRVSGRWELVPDCADFFIHAGEYDSARNIFDWRSYGMFGFLAGVRNYSNAPVISPPKGQPEDISDDLRDELGDDCGYYHSFSWLTATELAEYDYSVEFVDMRDSNRPVVNLRDFLGPLFFEHIEKLQAIGSDYADVRVVFAFDN